MNDAQGLITPIFVFSLPRSGSTLTQRILATHPAVATASEPWVLLPLIYSVKRTGIYSEYAHSVAHKAIEDFCSDLPGGLSDYLEEIRELAMRLYARKSGPNVRYFVDKTPRYHVIARDIVSMFSGSQFIFLWRNPLAIIASIIETWGKGRWNLYEFEFDLFDGLEALIAARRMAGDGAYSVRYEDLIREDSEARERLFRRLDLTFDSSQSAQFSTVKLTGRMGDQTGSGRYFVLSQEPREKWKRVLASPIRKAWCRRYLRWIGHDRLKLMGYDLAELLRELDSAPTSLRTAPFDLARMLFGYVVRGLEPWVMRDKLARLRRGHRLRMHS